MNHSLVAVGGFGLRIVPVASPSWLWLSRDVSQAVDCEVQTMAGERRFARVITDDGGYVSQLTPSTPSLESVVEVHPGPSCESWFVQTSVYSFPLIPEFVVFCDGAMQGGSPFTLTGPRDSSSYFQLGDRRPSPSSLVEAGQTLLESGVTSNLEWSEVAYQDGGLDWMQRHMLIPMAHRFLLVTMQAEAGRFREASELFEPVVLGLCPTVR